MEGPALSPREQQLLEEIEADLRTDSVLDTELSTMRFIRMRRLLNLLTPWRRHRRRRGPRSSAAPGSRRPAAAAGAARVAARPGAAAWLCRAEVFGAAPAAPAAASVRVLQAEAHLDGHLVVLDRTLRDVPRTCVTSNQSMLRRVCEARASALRIAASVPSWEEPTISVTR